MSLTETAMYSSYDFKWLIEPDLNGVQCSASADAPNGNLTDIQVAYCYQRESWWVFHVCLNTIRFAGCSHSNASLCWVIKVLFAMENSADLLVLKGKH